MSMSPEFATCKLGKNQSPIDIRGAKLADLAPIKFAYKPSPLKVIDNGHTIQVNYAPGNEATNLVTVPLDADGRLCVYSFERTDVVIDLLGSFGAPGLLRQFHVGGLVLDPLFRPDIHDYALHCTSATNPISFTATAMPGTTLTVDGIVSGTETAGSKSLAPNAALVVEVGTEEYWVRCLPPDFPLVKVKKTGTVAPGYYLMENGVAGGSGRFVMMLDTNGVPVWYRRVPASIDFKLLPDGNLAWMNFVRPNFNIDPTKRYEERTLDGTLVREIGTGTATPNLVTDYHDMIPLANGNFMVVSYSLRTVTVPDSYPPCGTGDEVIDGKRYWFSSPTPCFCQTILFVRLSSAVSVFLIGESGNLMRSSYAGRKRTKMLGGW